MSASEPLKGIELVDCAKANAKQGITAATELCGYGNDTTTFKQELQKACDDMGIQISELSDLITDEVLLPDPTGIEIAPDTQGNL